MKIGDKKIIVLEKDLFNPSGIPLFVEIEIIAERNDVKPDWNPDKTETEKGYKAKGKDGNIYLCQWEYFDDTSMHPYSNWQREAIEGRDYIKDGPWIGEDIKLYMGWDIIAILPPTEDTTDYKYQPHTLNCLKHLQKQFIFNLIGFCGNIWAWHNGKPNFDPKYKHNRWHYVADGCFFCNFENRKK